MGEKCLTVFTSFTICCLPEEYNPKGTAWFLVISTRGNVTTAFVILIWLDLMIAFHCRFLVDHHLIPNYYAYIWVTYDERVTNFGHWHCNWPWMESIVSTRNTDIVTWLVTTIYIKGFNTDLKKIPTIALPVTKIVPVYWHFLFYIVSGNLVVCSKRSFPCIYRFYFFFDFLKSAP